MVPMAALGAGGRVGSTLFCDAGLSEALLFPWLTGFASGAPKADVLAMSRSKPSSKLI